MVLRIESGGVHQLLHRQRGHVSCPALSPGEKDACPLSLVWLGQAGFALRFRDVAILIDPYLSDHLAEKYRGTEFPHQRMMASPIAPADIPGVDFVLCTHRHSDHMDPGTLPVIAANHPSCRFVVPRAEIASAIAIGLAEDRIWAVNAGDSVSLAADVQLRVIAAAHEELTTNDNGQHHFVGYVVRTGKRAVYHSGDCTPYDGLAEKLRAERIDLALLPVNGRDEYRRSRGVPGNMTFDEAVELCQAANIPAFVPHHFGMFDFNTVDPQQLRHAAEKIHSQIECVVPQVDTTIVLDAVVSRTR